MRNKFLNLFAIIICFTTSYAYALPDDQSKPIYIAADTAQINDKTGITTYTGNVIITQGSLLIEGARVDMHRGEDGIEKLIATGSPAHFRQRPQIDEPYSDAWGLHMVYQVTKQKLTITENAKVVQDKDTFTGKKIIYDLNRSIVNAFGSNNSSGKDDKPGRINMVIQPTTKKDKAN